MLEIDHNRGKYWKFGTGGSTSKPIQVWHSMEDWRGFALTANRHIEWDFYKDPVFSSRFSFDHDLIVNTELKCRNTPLNGSRIFGTYIGDHITNAIYARMLIGLGSEFEWRPSASSTLEDLYESTQNNKINGILAPPGGRRANKTKGSFLDNLLHYSAKDMNPSAWELSHRYNPNFNFIFWSSMPIDEQLLEYLENDLKIPYIKGHFGSTEICPTAATCSGYMRSFHLTNSNSLVLVVDYEKMQLAKPDQLGYTIVSKIGATNRIGESIVPTGMYFINYLTGDGAKLSNDGEICSCGRNTPILYDLQRLSFHEGKAIHGCQINLSDIN